MGETLNNRIKSYEEASDYKLINRLPVVIRLDIRGGHRITKDLERPFSLKFLESMAYTMLDVISQVDFAAFGFHYNDEISIIIQPNDQPWFQNKIQKLASVTASMASLFFIKNKLGNELELEEDAIFDASVYSLPSISESVNYLILQQQECTRDSISRASLSELIKNFGKEKAISMLNGKKIDERLDILFKECDINYTEFYPACFRNGVAAYKTSKIVRTNDEDLSKNKWILDFNVPIFVLEKDFVSNIIYSGKDVFRPGRDFVDNSRE